MDYSFAAAYCEAGPEALREDVEGCAMKGYTRLKFTLTKDKKIARALSKYGTFAVQINEEGQSLVMTAHFKPFKKYEKAKNR
jgi:hypothetical protein